MKLKKFCLLIILLLYVLPSWSEWTDPALCRVMKMPDMRNKTETEIPPVGEFHVSDGIIGNVVNIEFLKSPSHQKLTETGISQMIQVLTWLREADRKSPLPIIIGLILCIVLFRFHLHLFLRSYIWGTLGAVITTILTFTCYIFFRIDGIWFIFAPLIAYSIGFVIGLIQTFRHPIDAIRLAWSSAWDFSYIWENKPNATITSDTDSDYGSGASIPCCSNCAFNSSRGSFEVRCHNNDAPSLSANDKCGAWQHY